MYKLLTIIVCLIVSFATPLSTQLRGGLEGGIDGGIEGGLAKPDTIFVIQESFNYNGLTNWTESGGVAIAVHPTAGVVTDSVLETTVVSGGDYIVQDISDVAEYTVSWDFCLKSGYSGWDNDEAIWGSGLYNRICLIGVDDDNGTKYFGVTYTDDDGSNLVRHVGSAISDDTWYALRIHYKKATSDGADDGFAKFYVDGDSLAHYVNLNNDAVTILKLRAGNYYADELNATLYVDNVKAWREEGLP